MVTLMWVPYGSTGAWPILVVLALELVAFGIIAIGAPRALAKDRPDPTHLTEFYLILSTGGALASAFVAILAPILFPDIWEYPILLVGALVALALIAAPASPPAAARRPRPRLQPFDLPAVPWPDVPVPLRLPS